MLSIITMVTVCAILPHSLEVEFYNIEEVSGVIRVAVFNNQNDFDAQSGAVFEAQYQVEQTGSINIFIPSLSAGNYSIVAFHDINNNGELDTNLMGIPKEPYAFSKNVTAKWQKPTFEETRFYLDRNQNHKLRMAVWSKR